MYFLHVAVEYLETHPARAETLALDWKDRPLVPWRYKTLFGSIKTKSLFMDPTIPRDDDRGSVLMILNVGEGVIRDLLYGNVRNASNGFVLLEDLRNRSRQNGSSQNMGEMDFDVSWVQLYMVWNLSFCCKLDTPEIFCKLLIPAVVDATHPRWVERRTAALRMTVLSRTYYEVKPNWDMRPLQEHFSLQASVLKTAHQFITVDDDGSHAVPAYYRDSWDPSW